MKPSRTNSIGIIANPASGKDIRRLVSYATVIDNYEKINIVKRIVLAAQGMGIKTIYYMPDTFQIGETVRYELEKEGALKAELKPVPMDLNGVPEDTTIAAKKMEQMGVGAAVVMGGDGTSRAAAKGLDKMPILPVSTGTNNVYPTMIEGTIVGMAVAAVARLDDPYEVCTKDKIIEIFVNDEFTDIALIDAVLSSDIYVGTKAIWDTSKIKSIVVSRCHPASIGFSAIAGACTVIGAEDDAGYYMEFSQEDEVTEKVLAAIAAGVMESVSVSKRELLKINEPLNIDIEQRGIIAVDGEREITVRPGQKLTYKVTRNGPWRILPSEALELAQQYGMYQNQQ